MSSATAIAAKRAARREAGLCTECDTPRLAKHSVCARHLEQRRQIMARYNARRRAARLCYCGAPAERGRTRCRPCLDIETAASKDRYRQRRASGRCVSCGQRPPRRRKVQCGVCAGKAADRYLLLKRRKQAKRWRGVLWSHMGGHIESRPAVLNQN